MNKWSPERAEAIRRYIDEYFVENHCSSAEHLSKWRLCRGARE